MLFKYPIQIVLCQVHTVCRMVFREVFWGFAILVPKHTSLVSWQAKLSLLNLEQSSPVPYSLLTVYSSWYQCWFSFPICLRAPSQIPSTFSVPFAFLPVHVFVCQSQCETLHVVKEGNLIPLHVLCAAVSNLSYSITHFLFLLGIIHYYWHKYTPLKNKLPVPVKGLFI